jgi:catechol 2,3-dioxygenase-like lactoylglutathione lyase family enzyme
MDKVELRRRTTMSDIGLTHVALPVMKLETSIEFYRKYAGMQVVFRDEGTVWMSDRTRPFVIVLLEVPEVKHPLRPLGHLGVGCASREEVDQLSDMARSEGCLAAPQKDCGGYIGYRAFISDPDGHTLEVAFGQEVKLTVEGGRT